MDAVEKYGFKKISYWKFLRLMGMPKEQVVREIIGYGKDKKVYDKVNDLQAELVIKNKYGNTTKALFGIKRALRKLDKKYRLAVTSNCSHKTILTLLKNAGIDTKLINIVVGNDDVRLSKPNPAEIRKASKIAHIKADYVVGDSIYDIIAAKRARVKSIAVLTGHFSRKVLKQKKPEYIIKSVRYLPRLLRKIENES
jgi:phosphoglycolate phosphatase-like HAD superfamily hydrolase